jgi:hypothetical protein
VPIPVQLLAGLIEVSPVGGQGSLVLGDNGRPRGAGEARDEGAAAVAWCDVFGGVAILGRDNCVTGYQSLGFKGLWRLIP